MVYVIRDIIFIFPSIMLLTEGDNATALDIIAQTSWDKKNLDELVGKYDSDTNNEKVQYCCLESQLTYIRPGLNQCKMLIRYHRTFFDAAVRSVC